LQEIDRAVKALRSVSGVAASDTAIYTEIHRDATMTLDRPLAAAPDAVDLRIIEQLQSDGRLTSVDLAGRVGLAAASVRTRMRRLVESRAVTIQTLVTNAPDDPSRLGGFALDVHPDRGFDVQSVLDVEGVSFLAGSLGDADLYGTISATGVAAVGDIIERLRALPGVACVRSWIHYRLVREDYDRPLVGLLQRRS
jgi:DNA-binding Lrp family transcriptional regulator